MKISIKLITISLTIIIFSSCVSSRYYQPKTISVTGDFVHKPTSISFPNNFERFNRESITIFNKDSSNVGVNYVLNTKQDLRVTVCIYPASNGFEYRLRDEFFDCLQSIATSNNEGINTLPRPIKVAKDGYKVIGLSTPISNDNFKTVLVLFECGKYFLKYRISSSVIDTSALIDVSNRLLSHFSPIDIVKKQPLLPGIDIHISPGITTDSICLSALFHGIKAKIDWINNNVDSLEKCSGLPNLYFEAHKIAIDSMLNKWERMKHNNSIHDKYFNELLKIRESGFLNEFICEEYSNTLLIPESVKFDWDNYNIWRKKSNPSVRLVGIYLYLLGFEKSFEQIENANK